MFLFKRNLITSLVFSACLLSSVQATDRIVPDQYSTIQSAIDACDDWDRVLVKNGSYYENININKSITLQAYELYEFDWSDVWIFGTSQFTAQVNASNVTIEQINFWNTDYNHDIFVNNSCSYASINRCLIFGRAYGYTHNGILSDAECIAINDCYFNFLDEPIKTRSPNSFIFNSTISSSWYAPIKIDPFPSDYHSYWIGSNWMKGCNPNNNVGILFESSGSNTTCYIYENYFSPGYDITILNAPDSPISAYLWNNSFQECSQAAWFPNSHYFYDWGGNTFNSCTPGQWD